MPDPYELIGRRDASALLVIDMQNDFVRPDAPLSTPNAVPLVPLINSLAASCRENGLPVIYTQEMHRPGSRDFGIESSFEPMHCLEDGSGAEIFPAISCEPNDLFVQKKRRYDAFYGTDLDLLLRGQHIENIIIVGVCTDICVLATAVEARNRDYRCFVVRDAVDGSSRKRHDAALICMSDFFSYVGDMEEITVLFEL